MAITEKKIYGLGNNDMVAVVIKGALTPGAVSAGNYDDPLLDATNPVENGLMLLRGHMAVDVGAFTAGAGTVSVGVVAVGRDAVQSAWTLATVFSAITTATPPGNDRIPDIDPAGTGLAGKLGGLAIASTAADLGKMDELSLGMPLWVPTLRVRINTGVTSAPLVTYWITLRCGGARRS